MHDLRYCTVFARVFRAILEGKHEKMMKQVKNKKDLFWWTFPDDKNVNLNIVSIQDFKAKSIHKVFKVKK